MATKKKEITQMQVPGMPVAEDKEASGAAVWTGFLTVGLISLPVKLRVGAREERVSFNQLHAGCEHGQTRIKTKNTCPACDDRVLTADEIEKGFEVSPGRWVIVGKDELDGLRPQGAKVMEVAQFVKSDQIDPMLYETSYFIHPQEGGFKAYALIRSAMLASGYVATAKVLMHSREHLVVVRPYGEGLALHTLFYADEVRAAAFPKTGTVTDAELKAAKQLIEALSVPKFEHASVVDQYRADVKELIARRAAGEEPLERKPAQSVRPAVDIMSALQASIDQAKARKKAA